ncbi:hypothetical protein APSETT444_000461 [Aspergillus pseudonomiae]
MEKAPGVSLETKRHGMSKRERHKFASSFVEIKRFFNIPFGSIGSIYFKEDIPSDLQAALFIASAENSGDSERFCIGPTADYMFWYGKRVGLNIHRGPWNDPMKYLAAIVEKEIEWTRRYGKSMELDFLYNGVFPGEKAPEDYLFSLEKYLALVAYLRPNRNDSFLYNEDIRLRERYVELDSSALSPPA